MSTKKPSLNRWKTSEDPEVIRFQTRGVLAEVEKFPELAETADALRRLLQISDDQELLIAFMGLDVLGIAEDIREKTGNALDETSDLTGKISDR